MMHSHAKLFTQLSRFILLLFLGVAPMRAASEKVFMEACKQLLNSHGVFGNHQQRLVLEQQIIAAPHLLPALILGFPMSSSQSPSDNEQLERQKRHVERETALHVYQRLGSLAAPSSAHLIPGLSHPDPAVRMATAKAFGYIGYYAGHAIPELIELGRDPDARVAEAALESFYNMGPNLRGAQLQLIDLFSDEAVDSRIREITLDVLGELGREARASIPNLRVILRDHEHSLCRAALTLIENIGPAAEQAVPECQAILQTSQNQELIGSVLEAITAIGPAARVCLPTLLKMVQSNPSGVHTEQVLQAISSVGINPKRFAPVLFEAWKQISDPSSSLSRRYRHELEGLGSVAVPGLLAIVQDPDSDRKEAALETIQRMRRAGKSAAEALTQLLGASSPATPRIPIALALCAIYPEGRAYEPIFLQVLSGANAGDQLQVMSEISRIPMHSPQLVEALIAVLGNKPDYVARTAASTLADLGLNAQQALPSVHTLLNSSNPDIRASALLAIPKLGEPAGTGTMLLYSFLNDPDDGIRDAAIHGLAHYGPKSEAAIERLSEILLDLKDVEKRQAAIAETLVPRQFTGVDFKFARPEMVRCTVASTIGRIGLRPEVAVPALTRALSDHSSSVQEFAAISLGAYREAASSALPELRLLEERYLGWRSHAATIAIALIEPPSETGVRMLLHIAETTKDNPQGFAIAALGKMGSITESALPFLVRMSQSKSPYTSRAARRAIEEIKKK